jgi:dipeptide transport system permease protein
LEKAKEMGMKTFIIRRILLTIPTLVGVTLLIFAVVQLFTPVQRATLFVRDVKQMSAIPSIIVRYHLNESVVVQYQMWMTEVLHGNLGWSQSAASSVSAALIKKFPATLETVMFCIPIIILVGIFLGTKSAQYRDKHIDHATRIISIIGYSLPTFWLGILLIAIFSSYLHLLPVSGRLGANTLMYVTSKSSGWHAYTGLYTIDGILNGQLWVTIDALTHLVLPTVTLVTIQVALIIRVMRSSMLEALGKGYITAARAKGLTKTEVINKHARKNALIPVITLSGLLAAGLINGVTITETVFNIDGLGRWAANAGINLDIPAVLGFALFSCVIYVMANLLVDILYAYVDPRIRLIALLAPILAPPVIRDPMRIWNDDIGNSVVKPPGTLVNSKDNGIMARSLGYKTHLFGSIEGWDIYYGCIWGTVTAFRIGVMVVAISLVVGLAIGCVAGYYGGIIDEIMMRFTDIIFAFPALILAMALVLAMPDRLIVDIGLYVTAVIAALVIILITSRGFKLALMWSALLGILGVICVFIAENVFKLSLYPMSLMLTDLDKVLLALIVVGWPGYTRVIRGEILKVKQEDYIEAAKAVGCSDFRIMIRHIIPNSIYPILIIASLDIGSIVLLAAALSFLGIGAPTGYADWGQLINLSRTYIFSRGTDPWKYWYAFIIPGVFIGVFTLGWNLLGDAFRDILDPTLRRK